MTTFNRCSALAAHNSLHLFLIFAVAEGYNKNIHTHPKEKNREKNQNRNSRYDSFLILRLVNAESFFICHRCVLLMLFNIFASYNDDALKVSQKKNG